MSSDDIYRFRSFGPAPPRKPHQRSWRDPEKLREARQKQAQQVRLTEALKRDVPDVLSEKLGLGKWADEMLKQADPVRKSLRSGEPESEVRKRHPNFFAQVVDVVPSEDKNRLIQLMNTRHVSNAVLLDFMGKIKGNLAGETLRKYIRLYRSHQKLLNQTPPTNTPGQSPS